MNTIFIKSYKTETGAAKAASKLNNEFEKTNAHFFIERSLMTNSWLVVRTDRKIARVKSVPYNQSTTYLNK